MLSTTILSRIAGTPENRAISLFAMGVTAACVYFYYSPSFRKRRKFKIEELESFLAEKSNPGIRGLDNLANYCFMNVVLQCQASSPLFVEWLENVYHNVGERSLVIAELLYLIKKINTKNQSDGNLSGMNFLAHFTGQVNFLDAAQHDSLEFYEELHHVLERLRKYYSFRKFVSDCCQCSEATDSAEEIPESSSLQKSLRFQILQSQSTFSRQSIIVTPLGFIHKDKIPPTSPNLGISQTKILCSSCKHCEIKTDSFSYLSLPIKGDNMLTCLNKYFEPEHLEHYKCDNCKIADKCYRQLKIVTFPRLLVIHFQRLTWTDSGLIKLTQKVQFPSQICLDKFILHRLDEKRFVKGYRLVGVVVHVGNESGGHYINYRISAGDNKWYRVSDLQYSEVSEKVVLNCNSYMLYYEKSLTTYKRELLKLSSQL